MLIKVSQYIELHLQFSILNGGILMKKLVLLIGLGVSGLVHAEMDFGGYMRSGNGFNTHGGKYQAFSIAGAPGNTGRLGNEVGTYGEAVLRYWALKGEEGKPFFKSHVNIEYEAGNNTLYEGSGAPLQLLEAYIEGGNLENVPFTVWAGKRFYRDVDAHMNDLFYYADMSGSGAGLGSINLGFANMDLAFIQSSSKATQGTNTAVGTISKQALDLRLKGIAGTKLDLWMAAAVIPPAGLKTTTPTHAAVTGQSGQVIGTKFQIPLGEGSNTMAAVYGMGAMTDLSMGIDDGSTNLRYRAAKDLVKKQNRLRLINVYEQEINEKLAMQAVVMYEKAKNTNTSGVYSANKGTTYSTAGVRPMYYFSDTVQWVSEVTMGSMKDETADKTYRLTRVTTGPQVSLKKGQWGRPVIRAFVTNSSWNDEYKGSIATSNPGFDDKKSATQVGFQGEIWF